MHAAQPHHQQQPPSQQITPPQPSPHLTLQQPIPVAPLAQSSLLQVTPPHSTTTLVKQSSTPSQSPPPDSQPPPPPPPSQQQQPPPSLLGQLHLILTQQIQQQAQQTVQLQGSPGSNASSSPSAVHPHLQQLSNLQHVGAQVLANASPQQLQQIAMLTQQSPSSLPLTLLQIAQHDERMAMDARAAAAGAQVMAVPAATPPMPPQPLQAVQAVQSTPAAMSSSNYYVAAQPVTGAEVTPSYAMSEEVGADGVRRKGKLLAGSSCHQCKTRRISAELVYCAQSHAKKGRTRKRRIEDHPSVYIIPNPASTYKAERQCRKKYCSRDEPSPHHTLTASIHDLPTASLS